MTFQSHLYPDQYFEERLHKITPFAAPERKWKERDRDILALARPDPFRTILDLGSALGHVAFLLAPRAGRVIGIDASEKALAMAEARRRELGLENVEFLKGDVADLSPVPSDSIDVAGAFDLLEHIDDETLVRMLSALRRLLKKDGYLAAYTPNREHYVERLKASNLLLKQFPEHVAVRRPGQLVSLFEAEGWKVLSLDYATAPFPFVRWIEKALCRLPGLGRLFRYRILLTATPR
jgi:SAM-dependent methyltransferase